MGGGEGSSRSGATEGSLPHLDGDATMLGSCSAEPVAAEPQVQVGERIGRYIVLERIGAGAMGVVYAAYDPELDRKVALKVLLPRQGSGSTGSESTRLASEARALARLIDPNVVAVHDVGDLGRSGETRQMYIAMEFVAGRDLGAWMRELHADPKWRQGRRWREVLEVFTQAARGLAAAHHAGVVHRDFKPGNVLVGEDKRVRVADFGLARAPSARADADVDPTGTEPVGPDATNLIGTPAYMAPEQLAGDAATEASDQYALCTALFEALTGARPFSAPHVPALAALKLEEDVAWPEDAPATPRWLQAVVLRGLQREPDQRFGSMNALIERLQHDPRSVLRRVFAGGSILGLLAASAWLFILLTQPGTVTLHVLDQHESPLVPDAVLVDAAAVPVDGSEIEVELPAGTHRVQIEAQGYETSLEPVTVSRGSHNELTVVMHHLTELVDLDVHPAGATVRVDGIDRGSRLANLPIDTGTRQVQVSKVGHVTRRTTWDVRKGEPIQDFAYLPRSLVWRANAPDKNLELFWLGDLDGDGRSELLHRNFNMVFVYDPWRNRRLSAQPVGGEAPHVAFDLADADGDGRLDLVTIHATSEEKILAVRELERGDRIPALWSIQRRGDPEEVLYPTPRFFPAGGRSDVISRDPERSGLSRRDGRTGTLIWSQDAAASAVDLLLSEENIWVVHCEGVQAVDPATGALRWQAPLDICRAQDEVKARLKDRMNPETLSSALATSIDVDADGHDDLVVPAYTGRDPYVHAYVALSGRDGRPLWSTRVAFHGSLLPPHDDFDGDDVPDVVLWGSPHKEVSTIVLSGRTGSILWTDAGGSPSVIDAPGGERLLAVPNGPEVRLIDPARGRVEGSFRLPHDVRPPIRSGDFDADGQIDLLIADATPAVRVLEFEGRQRAEIPLDSRIKGLRVPEDRDGDGFLDLLADAEGAIVLRAPNISWERSAMDPLRGAPTVADLDGDGELEVAITGVFEDTSRLYVFEGRTGRLRWRSTEGFRTIRPMVTVPGEGSTRDLVLATENKHSGVVKLSHRGELLARAETGPLWIEPAAVDLDADGQLEVIAPTWNPGPIPVLDSTDLSVRAQWGEAFASWTVPVSLDVEADGVPEILVAELSGALALLDAQGRTRWRVDAGPSKHSFPAVVLDLEGDGQLELAVVATKTRADVMILDAATGETLRTFEGYGSMRTALAARDVDADGRPDIFASSGDRVCRLDTEGREVWCQDGPVRDVRVIFDLDSDGTFELLQPLDGGALHVLDAQTGRRLWMFAPPTDGRIEGAPVPADVDGDGLHEVFIASHDRTLRCLRSPPRAELVKTTDRSRP